MLVCKKLDQWRELFSPNTNNFFLLFNAFGRGRILESAMDKWKLECNAKLYCN